MFQGIWISLRGRLPLPCAKLVRAEWVRQRNEMAIILGIIYLSLPSSAKSPRKSYHMVYGLLTNENIRIPTKMSGGGSSMRWPDWSDYAIFLYKLKLGEFKMVSHPIRLILVDWFVFHFIFLGHLPFLYLRSSSFFLLFSFLLRPSSNFFWGRHSSFSTTTKMRLSSIF